MAAKHSSNTDRAFVDLETLGGAGWAGFRFGRYGKAKDWRIITPAGETLEPGELVDVRRHRLDLDFLETQVRNLEGRLGGSSMSFNREETQLIRVALQILLREVPISLGVRDSRVKVPGLRVAG